MLLIAAVGLFIVAAWRAGLGISYSDDAHYAAVTIRLAQGARPLADEMTAQALGFLVAVPFAKAWMLLFGTSGIVYALRLFYLLLAGIAGYVVFRLLRPSFGSLPSALAPAAIVLAPPYNIFGVSYNTSATLALLLAVAFGYAGVRDRRLTYHVAAGAFSVVAAFFYPPLAVGTVVFLACAGFVSFKRSSVIALLAGAAGAVAVLGVWLFASISMADVSRALAYSTSAVMTYISPGTRITRLWYRSWAGLSSPGLLVFWVLVVAASLPWWGKRIRATLAATLPLAAAYPGLAWLARSHDGRYFGAAGAATLYVFTLGGAIVVTAWTLQERKPDMGRLMTLAGPLGLTCAILIGYYTSSAPYRVVLIAGLAPLTAAVVIGWVLIVRDGLGAVGAAAAAMALVGVLVFQLYSTTFNDAWPLALDSRISSGSLAGIATTAERAEALRDLSDAGSRWVRKGDGVLVAGPPIPYLLVGGHVASNSVWLATGPADQFTLDYLKRTRTWPRVAFVAAPILKAAAKTPDPLVSYLRHNYRIVSRVQDYTVFVRR